MAVEARHHMNLFPSQLIANNRDFVKFNPGGINMYHNSPPQMDTAGLPFFNEGLIPDTLLPFYQSVVCDNPASNNKLSLNNNKADSGLTYIVPTVVPCNTNFHRKRPRDPFNDLEALASSMPQQKPKFSTGLSSFVNEDVVFQIQQQQSEIDRFIAEHTQKVRAELEERRKRQWRMLVNAIEGGVMKKLKEKDEELQRMGKLNWALQEKVKSLCMENQLWRDLAQTNEATANSLRTNLEQVLAQVSEERHVSGCGAAAAAGLADDEESSCGSSDPPRAVGGNEGLAAALDHSSFSNRACRKCGERESSVLLLPCRHLCLCPSCGSTSVRTCPVCHSVMTGSVHVNMP